MGLKESLRREEEDDDVQTSIQVREGCHSRKRKMEKKKKLQMFWMLTPRGCRESESKREKRVICCW